MPPTVSLAAPTLAALDEGRPGKSRIVVTRAGGDLSAPLEVRYGVSGTGAGVSATVTLTSQ